MTALALAPAKSAQRSAMSNGSRPFLAADGRSRTARLLRDREQELAAPLGGMDGLAVANRAKVEAAALLSVRLEEVRSGLARGEPGITDEDLVRLTNGLGRSMAALDKLAVARSRPTGDRPLQAFLARRGASG